jgi:hypothetical protein
VRLADLRRGSWSRARMTNIPSESQKPPYVENAVAPKTLRFLNSHMPASNCVSPP